MMYTLTLLHLLVLSSFVHFCLPLPVSQSSVVERKAMPQSIPGAGQTDGQAQATVHSEQTTKSSSWPNKKRDPVLANIEKEYPLTHAMLKVIRDALPVPEEGLRKRDNSSIDGIPSASSVFNSLSPDTQSMLKDTMRYGIALVMKQGAWALSP